MFKFWCHKLFFHTSFIFLMNNALFVIHSIIHSIIQWKYSFKEFIHSKKHENYSFKEFIHSKKIQNYSFKKFIHSRKSKIIHSKKIFIQVKNGLSPMANPIPSNRDQEQVFTLKCLQPDMHIKYFRGKHGEEMEVYCLWPGLVH